MKALIIREPWITHILAGRKTWEMRTAPTKVRGRIGLIRKGSGMVIGIAELVDSLPPLNAAGLAAARDRHAIPAEMDAEALQSGWLCPWVLRNAGPLQHPVPAGQKAGQVIWVLLADSTTAAIELQCASRAPASAHHA
jgi:hypothetical protein